MILTVAFGLPAASFILSTILTFIARKVAIRHDFVSRPSKDRYSQSVIALGGGVAIFWTIATILLSGCIFVKFLVAPGHMDWLGETERAARLEHAIAETLRHGRVRTADLGGKASTREMTEEVIARL